MNITVKLGLLNETVLKGSWRYRFQDSFCQGKKSMTQEEPAKKIDKKRTFISRVENDGENITLKTFVRYS